MKLVMMYYQSQLSRSCKYIKDYLCLFSLISRQRLAMTGCDQLVEIPLEDWTELKNLFYCDWPKHEFAYYLLENYEKWKDHQEALDVNCYSLNGNWRENETFVLKDGFEIYFYTKAEHDCSVLIRLLLQVEWDSFNEVSMDYLERHHPAIERIISDRCLKVASNNLAHYYFLSKEQALALHSCTIPEGFALNKLQLKDLDNIYYHWPLKNYISYEAGHGLLKRLIMLNENVGLFNEKGVLVSWCLSDQTGAHSDLQTLPAYCRKGYGRMVVMELAKRLAETGSDSKAYVLHDNKKSIQLFESIGFRKIQNLHWIVVNGKR
uniref:N-acetyltransferase domain-containing protein n=1 Tax=Anopheles funestus TaxID=62324 RepID=A0A1Y9HE67_ANOFN